MLRNGFSSFIILSLIQFIQRFVYWFVDLKIFFNFFLVFSIEFFFIFNYFFNSSITDWKSMLQCQKSHIFIKLCGSSKVQNCESVLRSWVNFNVYSAVKKFDLSLIFQFTYSHVCLGTRFCDFRLSEPFDKKFFVF